jgi:hypothetical protein
MNRSPSSSKRAAVAAGVLVLAVAAVPPLPAAAAPDDVAGPVVRLFPTNVVEDIRETGAAAAAMESGLQDVIARLDLQQQLYEESLCGNADADPGCERLARQLGATYLEMLEVMNEHLPAMETAVESTRVSLERRLREELGQKQTPSSLQTLLLGETVRPDEEARKIALRGRSGLRLSDRFRSYYQLVSTSGRGTGGDSLAVVASDIYLDMADASALISATRQEIARATLMEQLNQSLGAITPEMSAVVSGVKHILFGDPEAASPLPSAPSAGDEDVWRSPLAF